MWGWLSYVQWNQCSHRLTSRPLESCHHQCFKAVCGVFGYPKGSASELLDGTLKLRHCTDLFTSRFPPWSLPRVGSGGGKRWDVTPGHSSDDRSSIVKRVRLVQVHCFFIFRIQGIQRRGDGKYCAPPFLLGEGGEVGVPRNLFPRLGVG